jgi:hypothetical protein
MAMIRPFSTALVVASACAALTGAGFGVYKLVELLTHTEYVLALPDGAGDVREFHWADGVAPDFEYLLRAKIDEADFTAYVEDLGKLELHTASREYEDDAAWLDWSAPARFDGGWWDPGPGLDRTYVFQSKELWELVKYENGFLYVKAFDH